MEESFKVTAKFVSKKINKLRWRPTSKHVVQKATIFATGSWDDEENELSLWHVDEAVNGGADSNLESQSPADGEPSLICSIHHKGDVSDLLFLDHDNIVTASSSGDVFVYKYDQRLQNVGLYHAFEKLHHFEDSSVHQCPCTGLASRGDETVASVGEDGRLNLLGLETARTVHQVTSNIDTADSCSLNAVCFLTHSEVAAVNSIGQFKIWDIRKPSNDPIRVFVLAGERIPLHCMDRHPAQPHIVATGGADGTLYLWDMRQEKYPITLLAGHSSNMWDIRFHPAHPAHLFTCSNDGSLWHWDSSEMQMQGIGVTRDTTNTSSSAGGVCSWLMGDISKRHLVVKELLTGNTVSVNTLDVSGSMLVCGTDSEQICVVHGLTVC